MHRAIDPTPSHDVFWIFLLWRALHGGDPTLADVAAAAIASLSQFLPTQTDSFGVSPLPASPYSLGVSDPDDVQSPEADPVENLAAQRQPQEMLALLCYDPREFSIHHYYFESEGVFYRLNRPAFACLPTAA